MYMSPSDSPDHPESILYHSESSEVPYVFHKPVTDQELFFAVSLEPTGSSNILDGWTQYFLYKNNHSSKWSWQRQLDTYYCIKLYMLFKVDNGWVTSIGSLWIRSSASWFQILFTKQADCGFIAASTCSKTVVHSSQDKKWVMFQLHDFLLRIGQTSTSQTSTHSSVLILKYFPMDFTCKCIGSVL